MSKKKKRHIKLRIVIILIFLIILGIALVYAYEGYNKTSVEKIFEKIEDESAYLTEYTIYGTHLNLKRKNKW